MTVASKIPGMIPLARALSVRLGPLPVSFPAYLRRKPRDPAPRADCPRRLPAPRVDIPVRDTSPDAAERGKLRTQGRYLARQDRWETLARGLREADLDRAATPGGSPVARLLAQGACSDALDSAMAAVARNDATTARAILFTLHDAIDGIETDPWLACALAYAHVAVADAWAGQPGVPDPTPMRRDARAQHLEAAQRLVARFDPLELDSPALAALRCDLLELHARPAGRVADDYEDLIDLDPGCPDHLRALGRDLRPRRYGDWARLDHEARRTAGRTSDIWGFGGYSWVWLDALAGGAAGAFARVDADLFTEGLHDILAARPDQHTANLLAAYCGLTLSGAADPRSPRARIAGNFGWIVEDHLREIHPDLWACARPIPGRVDRAEMLRRGRSRAISALAEHFAPQLELGRSLRFTEDGIDLSPSPCASCTLAPCGALAYPHRETRDEDTPCLT
ncbi:hypothetical protein SAMN05444415_101420 [Salipiger profundus]|jgi:hypothetical protein|nr:hypothetical protein SAMN05444415_101420 [Salipiger profundus]